jgi:hypothetical protein
VWVIKISIGVTVVRLRRDGGSSSKNKLITHELLVVLGQPMGECLIAGIREIGTSGPLPDGAMDLREDLKIIP